jgi:hypothetical protein
MITWHILENILFETIIFEPKSAESTLKKKRKKKKVLGFDPAPLRFYAVDSSPSIYSSKRR